MLFRTIHDIALMMVREQVGHEAGPSAGVLDSQKVKAPAPGAQRGYDTAKKMVGRTWPTGRHRQYVSLLMHTNTSSICQRHSE